MLLGSFLVFFEAYCDNRTNDEIHANSSREPRNEYAQAAASVTDFQASAGLRGVTWGGSSNVSDWLISKPRRLFTSQRRQRCQLLIRFCAPASADMIVDKISIRQNCRPTLSAYECDLFFFDTLEILLLLKTAIISIATNMIMIQLS